MDQSCWFVTIACPRLIRLVGYGFTACQVSFPSCCEENNPDPKSGWFHDPDKLVWAMSCRGDVTDPTFCDFATNPRVSYRVGSSGTPPLELVVVSWLVGMGRKISYVFGQLVLVTSHLVLITFSIVLSLPVWSSSLPVLS